VLISDEALMASVKLTDRYVTDRMRPDKAIDALDEACAHLQAVTEYSPRTEELIRHRIHLIKQEAAAEVESARREREATVRNETPSAFERFGAELEALFIGMPAPVAADTDRPSVQAEPRSERPLTLAPLEADLTRQLMEEGVVIRGHDVARVVGLMAGKDVDWETEAAR
jgi:ATP-dependent Clp protease ATP-binding subunit ClpA